MDINDRQVSLNSLQGSVVVINFWATWCAPCVEERPTMDALKQSFSDRPFEILAINMAEDKQSINAFLARSGIVVDFPLLLDPGGVTANQYRVKTLPASLIVDKAGQFAYGGIGARDWNSEEVRNEILPLFDQ